MNKQYIGFGFDPSESKHHFLVVFPKSKDVNANVAVYERFSWDIPEPADVDAKYILEQKIDYRHDKLKCELSYYKWKEIESAVRLEFNQRLKEVSIKTGIWKPGQNVLQRLFGKELTLLCWAIEDCDIKVIPTAIKNWLGLKPEERWWLFTMTNAGTGDANLKFGWRTAIRYALTENPIKDRHKQDGIFGNYIDDVIKNQREIHGRELLIHRNSVSG